ncbi:MAG: PKD domain-containing protein [Verrucomicrobiota bacterium]
MNYKHHLLSILLAGIALCFGFRDLLGQNVPVVVPTFPTDQTFTPGELLYRHIGIGRVTNIAYHNGIVYTHNVGGGDRKSWEWSDSADASSLGPVLEESAGDIIPLFNDHGNHAHTKVGDYLGGQFDLSIRRSSPGVNVWDTHPEWAGVGGHRLYWPWALSFNWIQYSSDANQPTFIRRFSEELYVWDSLAEHGVTGNYMLMGNYLIVTSDESLLGILIYDLTPTFENNSAPVLLDKLSAPVGAYIAVLWENYIVLARRDTDQVDIVDWSDPTNLRFVTSIDVRGDDNLNSSSNVPYTQCQDQFVFTRRHKINMETFERVLEFDEVGNNRPTGSVSGRLGTSQYMLPVGQFIITGGYSTDGQDGIGLWAHQAEPDTRAPYVGYHIPRDGQTNYPVRAPISILIHETLESYTIVNGESLIVRPVGGSAIDAYNSFSHDDVLTITPEQPLQADTTYEVIIPAGGIKDAAGNGIEGYSFTFSTGGALSGGNLSPQIASFTATPSPTTPNTPITFSASATDPESDTLEYRFSFSDGSTATDWGSSSSIVHQFANEGHYEAKVQVRDLKPGGATSVSTEILSVTIANPIVGVRPTKSSPITLDAANRKVWVVNPDNDSITRLNADTRAFEAEFDLGAGISGSVDPRSIAIDANGDLWVACRDADGIAVMTSGGVLLDFIDTGYGSAPVGVAASADGSRVLATLERRGTTDPENGQLLLYNTATGSEIDRLELGPMPRAIAITGNGQRALVTRFISTENYGEVWDVAIGVGLSLTRTILIGRDRGSSFNDSSSDGKGVPNYLAGITLSPDNEWAWFTAVKANTQRGEFFNSTGVNASLTPDHTVRAMVGRIDLSLNREPTPYTLEPHRGSRIDVDNSDSPTAVAFSDLGDYVFVTLQGNDGVAVYDRFDIIAGAARATTWRIPSGAAPQGILLDPATNCLWIKDFMGRTVTVHDLSGFFGNGDRTNAPVTVSTVANEALATDVLDGKRIFYSASDEMSLENYISCASCHVDGMHDGRTYDFTQRGEGFRNTTDLRGRGGMDHGNVHWSANFDEIQDFILDITRHFGGTGLLDSGEQPNEPLSLPNGQRAMDLDSLSAYVTSLKNDTVPRSPHRNFNGTMTAEALAGESVFSTAACVSCHAAPDYTDSTLGIVSLHNVGTLRTSSGLRLNGPLSGIDTPSLLGAWDGAPYFHDGSAQALEDVFSVVGGVIYPAEDAALSGSASVPNYIDVNWDSSSRGSLVALESTGASVTFNNVDGGSGGIGQLELRLQGNFDGEFRVTVNGTQVFDLSISGERTLHEWNQTRVEGISFSPGATNVVVVTRTTVPFALDDITVAAPDHLALAAPHRIYNTLSSQDRDRLLAYVRQIDGRDPVGAPLNNPPVALGTLSVGQLNFGDGFSTAILADASNSFDSDGAVASYHWSGNGIEFVNGTTESDAAAEFALPGAGNTVITLTVTDDDGAIASALFGVRVVDGDINTLFVQGIEYTYYQREDWFSEFQNIDFDTEPVDDTGTLTNFDISSNTSPNLFLFRFTGYVYIDTPGDWTFYTTSDDGSRMFVNGTRVVNNDGVHGTQTRQGTTSLGVGYHEIVVDYFNSFGSQVLTVEFEGPGTARQAIPDSALFRGVPIPRRTLGRAMFDNWTEADPQLVGLQPDSDPFNTGRPLYLDFVLADTPGQRQFEFALLSQNEGGTVVFRTPALRTGEGLNYRVEYSTDLVDWFDNDGRFTLTMEPAGPGMEVIALERDVSGFTGPEFIRVNVSLDDRLSQ